MCTQVSGLALSLSGHRLGNPSAPERHLYRSIRAAIIAPRTLDHVKLGLADAQCMGAQFPPKFLLRSNSLITNRLLMAVDAKSNLAFGYNPGHEFPARTG